MYKSEIGTNAGKIWRGRLLSRAFNGGGMD